jgi:hypothetical protein
MGNYNIIFSNAVTVYQAGKFFKGKIIRMHQG